MSKNTQLGNLVNGIYVDSTGKVGVGTQSPSVALDVVGAGKFSGALTGTSATFSSSVTATQLITKSVSGAAALFLKDGSAVDKWEIGHISNALYFYNYTANTEAMRITSAGNVGIGTTAPSSKLEVSGYGTANSIMTYPVAKFYGAGSGGLNIGTDGTNPQIATDSSGVDLTFLTRVSGIFYERVRINSGGGLIVATNNSGTLRSSIGEGTLELVRASSNTVQAGSYLQFTDPSNARYWVLQQDASFNWATWHYNGGWAKVGYQTPAGTWTNSDIRRKKDFENVNYGLSEVLQLNPQKYRFIKQTEDEQKSLGFIAQEVLQIVPEAVQSDMDGEEQYYAMNYSNLVPVLVKAIQELKAEIDILKNK